MSDTTEKFVEFIQTHPGMCRDAVVQFEDIDKRAVKAARLLMAHRDAAWLRKLAADPALSPSARAQNQIMADALERDPTGRLAVVPSLRAWASRPDGIGNTWITWYQRHVALWIADQKASAPPLVPMMVEGIRTEA